jgi:hypothetical protein
MEPPRPVILRSIPPLIAVGIVSVLFAVSREPTLSEPESEELASRFRFARQPLPNPFGQTHKSVRSVHPSLQHISGMISYVGAAVSLADLDGDGMPNDLVYVDPRVDQVIVAAVPGTEKSRAGYRPFALNPAPLAHDPATMAPTGCLVGDFDEDGSADILVYFWGRSPILFFQRAGSNFDGPGELTSKSFVPCELVDPYQRWFTCAVTQADLDGDGHLDLVTGNYFADGARILDAGASGVEQLPDSLSRAFNGGRKHLFLWQKSVPGPNPFREAETDFDAETGAGWIFAVGAADLDGDMLPEIYFVQDFGPDRLFHNRSQPGKLRLSLAYGERTLASPRSKVVGRDSFNGMGIDFGDLNGDGWPDMFVSNITGDFGLHESHFAFLSTGQVHRFRDGVAPYRDESEKLGLSRSGWAWEARLGDFDNDGVLEAMQATGATKGTVNRWPELQELALGNDRLISNPRVWHHWAEGDGVSGSDHNPFFVRARDGRYYDISDKLGLAEPMLSRGIATADVDGDGRLDFALANQWGPSFFLQNEAPKAGAFLGLNLRIPLQSPLPGVTIAHPGRPRLESPSRAAIGATAKVHLPDGRVLVAQVDGGTGHSGKRSPELHFGLGQLDSGVKLRVEVRWRGGDGEVREHISELSPGWHTLLLGNAPGAKSGGGT